MTDDAESSRRDLPSGTGRRVGGCVIGSRHVLPGLLAVVASIKKADTLSTVARAVAVVAFFGQLIVFVVQVAAANSQTVRSKSCIRERVSVLDDINRRTEQIREEVRASVGVVEDILKPSATSSHAEALRDLRRSSDPGSVRQAEKLPSSLRFRITPSQRVVRSEPGVRTGRHSALTSSSVSRARSRVSLASDAVNAARIMVQPPPTCQQGKRGLDARARAGGRVARGPIRILVRPGHRQASSSFALAAMRSSSSRGLMARAPCGCLGRSRAARR
jgi:hypothetical protein